MKGEFEKRSQAWVPKKPNDKGVYVAGDWVNLEVIDEARKEFYVILNDATNHPFEHTINRFDECIEKWFGTAK